MGALSRLRAFFSVVMDREIKMNSYEDRITLQKLIYALKSAGIKFNYSFNWYLRGPYSVELADDGFKLAEKIEKNVAVNNCRFSEKARKIIERMKECFGTYFDDSNKLELLASLLYLKNDYYESAPTNKQIIEAIESKKPWYEESEIQNVIKDISNSGLFRGF